MGDDLFKLLAVAFGFFLGLIPPWLNRKRRLKAHWGSLRVEIELCREKATGYPSAGIAAPLYRLPVDAFRYSFPVLLAEGVLEPNDVRALSRFYGHVEDIDRGLDQIADVPFGTEHDPLRNKLFSRLCMKAADLLEGELLRDAHQVVDKGAKMKWYRPPRLKS